jgi:hypothetical protein
MAVSIFFSLKLWQLLCIYFSQKKQPSVQFTMDFFLVTTEQKFTPHFPPLQKQKKKQTKQWYQWRLLVHPMPQQKLGYVARGFPLVPHFEEFSPVLAEPQYIPCQLLTLTICCFQLTF